MREASARQQELISFKDYCDRVGLSPVSRAGFEVHVKLHVGDFNYRSATEWDCLKTEFLNAARRRP